MLVPRSVCVIHQRSCIQISKKACIVGMNNGYINHNNYIESEPIVRTLKCNSILSHATYCNSAQFRFCKTVLASESYITCYAWPRPRFERVWKQSTKVNIRKALILGVVDSFKKNLTCKERMLLKKKVVSSFVFSKSCLTRRTTFST